MIKIEKNIPLPIKNEAFQKYPIEEMEIGDSFFVGCSKKEAKSEIMKILSAYKYRFPDRKIIIRSLENGFRVWRVNPNKD